MGAQGDHEIQLPGILQDLHNGAEEERQGQGAGVVGDQHQHLLTGECTRETADQGMGDFLVCQVLILPGNGLGTDHEKIILH